MCTSRSAAGLCLRPRAGLTLVSLLAGALVAGCNAHTQANSTAQWSIFGEPSRVAAAPTPAQVEMEDDGQEAQLPPLRRTRAEPDDPSEPYSRNYGTVGGSRAAGPAAPPAGRERLPSDLPPAFRRQLASALASDD
jgi:hypothetical protein